MREDRRGKPEDGHTPQNRASNRRKSIFEVLQMDVFPVNWDSVPEVMNKEQFFRICHISKSTALHLLKSGKVPCEWSGKKTRCYKIRKENVKAYLEERAIFPELYSAPKGWYGTHYVARLSKELPEDTLRQMHGYYEKLLRKYPDVVTGKGCGDPDRLHPDHRPQLVQPRVVESLPEGAEVLHSKDLSR